MANGLAYLHGIHIIHRDVKSSNYLVCTNNQTNVNTSKQIIVKIADFGLSRTLDVSRSGHHMATMTEVRKKEKRKRERERNENNINNKCK